MGAFEDSRLRYSAMIKCFLDDSGKETGSPFVIVAGYVAQDVYWQEFNDRWRHLLLKYGIREVHMKDLIGINREYKQRGFDIETRDALLNDCASIIKYTQLIGIGVAVDAKHYSQLSKDRRRRFGTAEEFCFQRVIRLLMDLMDRSGTETRVSVMADFDVEYASGRHKLFNVIRQRDHVAKRRLASIAFGYTQFYPELQAADVLAWETRKEIMQKAGGFNSTKNFIDLMTAMPGKFLNYESELWSSSTIEEEFSKIEKEMINRSLEPVSPKIP